LASGNVLRASRFRHSQCLTKQSHVSRPASPARDKTEHAGKPNLAQYDVAIVNHSTDRA
jgi:hypothetical protein